jgi:IS5 family transposase
MTQLSFSDAEHAGKRKRTRREVFLEEMERVVPWSALLSLVAPHYPKAGRGRRPYAMETMLRIHLLQQWYALSDPAMEEALYEIASMRQFARLSLLEAIPDETTILNFRHLLERHGLAARMLEAVNGHLARQGLLLRQGTIMDATIIDAPSSTKNREGKRDPQMHQTKKGNQWFFGMKIHVGVDSDSGLIHTAVTTAANVADVTQAAELLHGHRARSIRLDAGPSLAVVGASGLKLGAGVAQTYSRYGRDLNDAVSPQTFDRSGPETLTASTGVVQASVDLGAAQFRN